MSSDRASTPSGEAAEIGTPPAGTGVRHGALTLVRELPAPPERVFAAFAELPLRRRWFRLPGVPDPDGHRLDFRVGGHETVGSTFAVAGTPEHIAYGARYLDIAADERIVSAGDLAIDGLRRSVSLLTVEFAPGPTGTRLTYTDQYVLLDVVGDGSAAVAEREGGTRLMLNRMAASLAQAGTDVGD